MKYHERLRQLATKVEQIDAGLEIGDHEAMDTSLQDLESTIEELEEEAGEEETEELDDEE